MNANVKQTLFNILSRFKTGDIPKAIAFSMYPIPNVPSTHWSLLNRTIMFCAGSMDCRGWAQWRQAGRYVKAGSKAVYILIPYIKFVDDEEGQEKQALYGFGCKPVFRVQDTEGDPLDYENIEVPDLPLIQRAVEWGINVKAVPGNYSYYGYYSSPRKEIALASKEEVVFFHELSHCADEILKGSLKKGQDPLQEITAELCSLALCALVGKSGEKHIGNSYMYIHEYASKVNRSPLSACVRVIKDVEGILNLILKGDCYEERLAV
ncbi:MAG: antirestriction protein [Deltaproteobacteria bacterium]|nr:antirestriction protein [Deltaproteobacteria bacterium]